ncbi:hypothetical protein EYY60_21305 [Flavobacterium zhairuonense]|uniref:hypothetical protein n=1 Tax=Flavobacterium zhairuonense TaxID=2493631 RepID=UPI0010431CE8|nr:hypothetical protein [Flavobacterium zhairuonense]KAF2507048.1 hypothetical protein EYY60_21305 [Flavobacterium zhairuonense]
MKKLVFAAVLFMSVFFAQAQVSINVNIGTPPNWGPQGYDDSRYYYLPDIDVYYDVNQSVFIYDNNGKWIRDKRLPSRCRQYDLYSGYKVVLNDYKGDAPYNYHTKHRANYPKGYQGKPQKNRGEKPAKNNNSKGKQKHENKEYTNKEYSNKEYSNKDHDRSHGDHH